MFSQRADACISHTMALLLHISVLLLLLLQVGHC
jgi:hypothetical protein